MGFCTGKSDPYLVSDLDRENLSEVSAFTEGTSKNRSDRAVQMAFHAAQCRVEKRDEAVARCRGVKNVPGLERVSAGRVPA